MWRFLSKQSKSFLVVVLEDLYLSSLSAFEICKKRAILSKQT